jgi:hypothetical protein
MAGLPFSIKELNKNPDQNKAVDEKGRSLARKNPNSGGIIIEPRPEPEIREPMQGLLNAHSLTGTAPTDKEWKAYADLWVEGRFGPEWQEKFDDNFSDRNHFRRVIEPVLADLATRSIRAKEAARIQAEQVRRNEQSGRADKIRLLCCGTWADPQTRLSFNHELGFYLPCSTCGKRNKVELKVKN